MGDSKFSDRLARLIEDDSTFESELGGYMGYSQQMDLEEAGYLVPLPQFRDHLNRYAQDIQKAVKSHAAQ